MKERLCSRRSKKTSGLIFTEAINQFLKKKTLLKAALDDDVTGIISDVLFQTLTLCNFIKY